MRSIIQHHTNFDATDGTNSAPQQDVWANTDDEEHLLQPHVVSDDAAASTGTDLSRLATRGKSSVNETLRLQASVEP